MGATIPVAMFAIRRKNSPDSQRSFSFLYLANVLGAALGAILPLFFIETRGFYFVLGVGAVVNCTITVLAFLLTLLRKPLTRETAATNHAATTSVGDPRILPLLFMTGLVSMALEVAWIRMFTPFVGVVVYSFAAILAIYLVATFIGSSLYRDSRQGVPARVVPFRFLFLAG
jgi:spermidine synthase